MLPALALWHRGAPSCARPSSIQFP
jgi:hypothetical protein